LENNGERSRFIVQEKRRPDQIIIDRWKKEETGFKNKRFNNIFKIGNGKNIFFDKYFENKNISILLSGNSEKIITENFVDPISTINIFLDQNEDDLIIGNIFINNRNDKDFEERWQNFSKSTNKKFLGKAFDHFEDDNESVPERLNELRTPKTLKECLMNKTKTSNRQ
jgi:hypothetical protein